MQIKYIDIMADKVYIEFINNESKYTSFTNIKKIINEVQPKTIKYNCVDNEKSIKFLNTLLNKYMIKGDVLYLK
jgi:hypothetical protein